MSVRALLGIVVCLAIASPVAAESQPRPVPNARVLLLYVDGLRPDVVREMAASGELPVIQELFLTRGVECARAFTTFPSNTLVANGALWTGLLPDATGIKSQNQFERTTLTMRGQVSELLPDWWMERFGRQPRVSDLLDKFAPENTHDFLRRRGVPTLAGRLGPAFRSTILPIVPMNPPTRWLHRAVNAVDHPFVASWTIPHELDRINARYVIEELLGDPKARVIAAWFPMVDHASHHQPRGQFGQARRQITMFDRLLGKILRRLKQVHWDASTYVILVSDHGHVGGETEPSRPARFVEELWHRRLGCNVRVVGHRWTVPGSDPERFVFVDHQAWGQAAIFLPQGAYHTGPWRRNSLHELMHYDLGPNRGAVNVVEELLRFRPAGAEATHPRPVDLLLVKVDAARVLVMREVDNAAFIHTLRDADGQARYRYEPSQPGRDPLGYLADAQVRAAMASQAGSVEAFLAHAHTADEWLQVTAESRYPDAILGLATYFAWRSPTEPGHPPAGGWATEVPTHAVVRPMDNLAEARDPDLLVTASPGWSFRTDGEQGTDHGAPLREAMRISLFVSGPNIRPGVIEEPHRIIDVMPTILQMIGSPYDPTTMDGRPIEGLYE